MPICRNRWHLPRFSSRILIQFIQSAIDRKMMVNCSFYHPADFSQTGMNPIHSHWLYRKLSKHPSKSSSYRWFLDFIPKFLRKKQLSPNQVTYTPMFPMGFPWVFPFSPCFHPMFAVHDPWRVPGWVWRWRRRGAWPPSVGGSPCRTTGATCDEGGRHRKTMGQDVKTWAIKNTWLIDCYRGLYYLVYWGLWQPIVGKPINQLV